MYIAEAQFNAAEEWILEHLDGERLEGWIDFLRGYKEVMWWNSDGDEPVLVPYSELPGYLHVQPLPEYPKPFREMGEYFDRLCSDLFQEMPDLKISLQEEGFFEPEGPAARNVGTYYSPVLICLRISDAYCRDCFCDGLFGTGVENCLYLKMLLHLDDAKEYYGYLHGIPTQKRTLREKRRIQQREQLMKRLEKRRAERRQAQTPEQSKE